MIINTGQRTDIPAFYSDWFFNRIKEGYVYVRNPYYPKKVTEYQLNPQVVDCLCFCTKNPQSMLKRLDEIKAYRQYWFVTITPYGKEIEPYVPSQEAVIKSFQELSIKVKKTHIGWRYDPIFISKDYTIERHLQDFESIAKQLSGYTHQCVISFIDLYQKTIRNFPGVQEVTHQQKHRLAREMSQIAKKYHMKLYTCAEGDEFDIYGINSTGCMSKEVIEKAIGEELLIKPTNLREGCQCLIGHDIGAYHSCLHGCLYCYANESRKRVLQNYQEHDPMSPLLIGHINKDDIIVKAKQQSDINKQLSLFL